MSTAANIWGPIIAPDEPNLSEALATYFLSLKFTDEQRARYQSLASKEQVELTAGERTDLEDLVHANTVLMLLQSKARLSLKKRQPAA